MYNNDEIFDKTMKSINKGHVQTKKLPDNFKKQVQ